jgi:hypothetical protein
LPTFACAGRQDCQPACPGDVATRAKSAIPQGDSGRRGVLREGSEIEKFIVEPLKALEKEKK